MGDVSPGPLAGKFLGEISKLQNSPMIFIAPFIYSGWNRVQIASLGKEKKVALPSLGLHKLVKAHGGEEWVLSAWLGRGNWSITCGAFPGRAVLPASRTSLITHQEPHDTCAA